MEIGTEPIHRRGRWRRFQECLEITDDCACKFRIVPRNPQVVRLQNVVGYVHCVTQHQQVDQVVTFRHHNGTERESAIALFEPLEAVKRYKHSACVP